MTDTQRNRAIAYFMGMKLKVTDMDGEYLEFEWVPSFTTTNWCFEEPPPFNSSWNWLMPVFEKIKSMGHDISFSIEDGLYWCCIFDTSEKGYGVLSSQGNNPTTFIGAVYNAVVGFIEQYR